MEKLCSLGINLLKDLHFDCLAVGVVDFDALKYQAFEISGKNNISKNPYLYFDLASLTKFLTLSSVYFMHPDLFDDKMVLLLNHQGGITSHGRLPFKTWKDQILSYPIKKSPTNYSDYSALRLQLELEKKSGTKLKELCDSFWDKDLLYWTDLSSATKSPITGIRSKKEIAGQVHDDNAFNLKECLSHAGLFATIDGLCKSLINLQKGCDFIKKWEKAFLSLEDTNQRFVCGCDRVINIKETLAGDGASIKTFGHLGFTGTSIWIDVEKMYGSVILTNATKNFSYCREGLRRLRMTLGSEIWKIFKSGSIS